MRPHPLFSVSGSLLLASFSLLVLTASDAGAAGRRSPKVSKKIAAAEPAPPSAREARAYRAAWSEALRDYRRGDFAGASAELEKLRRAERAHAPGAGGDPLAELYRTIVSAQAFWRARDTARAEAALGAALAMPAASDAAWQRYLHRMRMRFAPESAPAARKEYLLSVLRAPVENTDKAEALYRLLALDTAARAPLSAAVQTLPAVTPAERAAWARQLIALAVPGARFEREYRRWATLADSTPPGASAPRDTTRETQRLLLDWEEKLGQWDRAIARAAALAARDTGSERAREAARGLQMRVAQWHYNAARYDVAIQEYLRIRDRFGDNAEVLMQLARAYRALGQDGPAQSWYTRLTERFPKDGRTAEVLWMRAFDDEMAGKSDTAAGAYARIARDFPAHARSGEAMFRLGLVRFRAGDHAGARQAFFDLRLARKSGRLTGAAHYWEGRALAAAGQDSAARAAWGAIARDYPFGHYGHLARAELVTRGALPDSLEWSRRLNTASGPAIRDWFFTAGRLPPPSSARGDSVTPVLPRDTVGPLSPRVPERTPGNDGFAPRFGESAWMPVETLVDLGLDTLAVLTLQARANAAPANLWLIYDAAVRCRTAGFGYEAYRFAVRLSDRLPMEQWPYAPVEVLRLFYPPSYIELVRPEARRAGIPAALALALIKQESGFDPGAVSRVGARGLMQLMPATGAEQARKEGFKGFHPDSLFTPAVNIRLGVAYLRDVLARHEGNVDYALAHYNAGPTALARWMPRLRNRPSEDAVEDIGYAETREYVKRVGANYKTYQVLWEGTGQ